MSVVARYAPPDAYQRSYDSTSTMGDEPLHVASGVQSVDVPQCHNNPCLIEFRTPEPDANGLLLHETLWLHPRHAEPELNPGVPYVVVIEPPQDQIGDLENAAATADPCPPIWHEAETESYDPRGVLVIPHKREVIFTKQVRIRTADLPFLKPRFNLDDGPTLEPDDE